MNNLPKTLTNMKAEEVLGDIDLEFCRFLQNRDPDITGQVLLAAALTSLAYRQGNICIALNESNELLRTADYSLDLPDAELWVEHLRESKSVGAPGEFKPLILDESGRLYLHKLWRYEQSLAHNILAKAQSNDETWNAVILKEGLERLFEDTGEQPDWQKIAAIAALHNNLTVISGGPGTGKTTTVAKIMALLVAQKVKDQYFPDIALAAPTGKAAARLKESIISTVQSLNVKPEIKDAIPSNAVTLHQLLGARRQSSTFRYNKENPLPYDVVIIDEASMVDQALMSRLVEALLHDTKLILLGDKDQLASVEAGSVLGSICSVKENTFSPGFAEILGSLQVDIPEAYIRENGPPMTDTVILLQKSYRFDKSSGIPALANLINNGEGEKALKILEDNISKGIVFNEFDTFQKFENDLKSLVEGYIRDVLITEDPAAMFDALKSFQLLSPHRRGPLGVEYLNRQIENKLEQFGLISRYDKWYHGKPIIVNRNDYSLGLNNGDIGLCCKGSGNNPMVFFPKEGGFRQIPPSRLPDTDLAFAMTVHKSQGSEFEHVHLVLPPAMSKVLTRELLYTAITRARRSITITARKQILINGIETTLQRSSGLKDLLWTDS